MRQSFLTILLAALATAAPLNPEQPASQALGAIKQRDGTTEFDPDGLFKEKRDGTTEFDPDGAFKEKRDGTTEFDPDGAFKEKLFL
ncbi:hypothetical protein VP1G_00607 [Cytospora mali]|uniref:Uncharacterized protein n=1 Tax=Cytospora mali TaxID=578113 RepID=A0A194UNK5_CYTMA|nr:hypothetical protein VP1G_00607 [Valsa mali var. pyri (nom. inval.)]